MKRTPDCFRLRASFFGKETGSKEIFFRAAFGGCVFLPAQGRLHSRPHSHLAFFLSAPTELEPYSRLNRTTCGSSQIVRFSTSRQGTPHFVSGERYFFVMTGSRACASCRDSGERSDFKVVFTPPRCLRPFSDTKKDCRIFPTKEPSDFFFGPYGVKKFTPPDGRGTLKKFLEKNHRNRLVRVQRNGQTDKPSACVI